MRARQSCRQGGSPCVAPTNTAPPNSARACVRSSHRRRALRATLPRTSRANMVKTSGPCAACMRAALAAPGSSPFPGARRCPDRARPAARRAHRSRAPARAMGSCATWAAARRARVVHASAPAARIPTGPAPLHRRRRAAPPLPPRRLRMHGRRVVRVRHLRDDGERGTPMRHGRMARRAHRLPALTRSS
jgi:hypothetical protein